jgi:opacity protein-like surface antigen
MMILGVSTSRYVVALCIAAFTLVCPMSSEAQLAFRGFADAGSTTFTAEKSFAAVLGTTSGPVFGGGVELVERNIFLNVRASRFQKTGERVFVFEGEEFPLGIPETITVTPIQVNGGYRFDFGSRVVPYAGIGVGWHTLSDTSEFADDSENLEETYRGFQVTGGAEFRVARWLGIGGEAEWSRVPNGLGQTDNSVAKEFGETDLGGTTFRVRIVIGR